jgi:elongation of very long chain fatty acids protein 4
MYSYYTMALLGWSCPWKRYLTQCQLVQFCICLTHSCYAAVSGIYPFHICLIEIWVMLSMLVLFTRFYNQAYAKEKEAKRLAAETTKVETKAATLKAQ